MSHKPNPHKQQQNRDSKKQVEPQSDDLDFWNINTNPNNRDMPTKETEESAPDSNLEDHLNNNSEEEINIGNLDEHNEIQSKPKSTKSLAKAEKIATFFCCLAILGVLSYLIIYASKQHDFDNAKSYETKIKAGNYATIEDIETWWSEPQGNKTKIGVVLVPSATITLSSNSKNGIIRTVFYSSEEGLAGQLKPKGDPFTNEFADGKFLASGTNQITIYGTDGFAEHAHYQFYRSQNDSRWTIEIKEAPSTKANIQSLNVIANAPIEPISK